MNETANKVSVTAFAGKKTKIIIIEKKLLATATETVVTIGELQAVMSTQLPSTSTAKNFEYEYWY